MSCRQPLCSRPRSTRSPAGLALLPALVLAPSTAAATLGAQQNFEDVRIETLEVAEGLYMLRGAGGNIGLSVGSDGVFMIDDQFAPLTERILAAVAELTDEPVRFVINTHWHGDHTGGNENMGEAGAILVSHENVRRRLSVAWLRRAGDMSEMVAARPGGALPVVTFTETVSFHLNGHEMRAFHVPHAHTDGDAIIHVTDANVVHMGDTYFQARYPFVDVSSGGSIDGLIAAINSVLAFADDETRIIPGHGDLSDIRGLRAYRDMLRTVRNRVAAGIAQGHGLERIKADDPIRGIEGFSGNSERFVDAVYESLIRP